MTNIDYPASAEVQFAYDALNRLTNMVDAVGTTKFTYSAAGQLLTEDGPFASDTVTNIYWNRMRTNLSLPQSAGVWMNTFGYSTIHRLNSVTSPAGALTYNYSEVVLPNGTSGVFIGK